MSLFVLAPEPEIENSCQENNVFAAFSLLWQEEKDILQVCNLYSAFKRCVMAYDVNSSLKISWARPRASTLSPLRLVYLTATASCPRAGTAHVVSAPEGRWTTCGSLPALSVPSQA